MLKRKSYISNRYKAKKKIYIFIYIYIYIYQIVKKQKLCIKPFESNIYIANR